jgi:hypothetical protein
MRTEPRPPQVRQPTGEEPGLAPLPWQVAHSTASGRLMVTVSPKAACSSSSSTS